MARKVALINMKGGVGKSTLCINLAWYFALPRDSKCVLVVDLDPQFNASQYLLGTQEYERILRAGTPTTWDIFERNTRTPYTPGQPFDVRTHFTTGWLMLWHRVHWMSFYLDLSWPFR